jgi:hypothetical protein
MSEQLPEKYEPGFLRKLDKDSEISRRLHKAFHAIVEDVSGDEPLSHIQFALIERFVFLEAMMQSWEAEIANNPSSHEKLLSRWIQALNTLQGLAGRIGIEVVPKKHGMTLQAYLGEERESA